MKQQAKIDDREMPDADFCGNVENLRSAATDLERRMIELKYLLLVARFAALWEKEHVTFPCDEEGYCCWSMFLEGPIASAMAPLSVAVSDFNNAAHNLVNHSKEIPAIIDSFKKAVYSIDGLVHMFDIAAGREDENGRDENNTWDLAFETLFSIMENFMKRYDDMWYGIVEPLIEMTKQQKPSSGPMHTRAI
jgi:hypothetical protein